MLTVTLICRDAVRKEIGFKLQKPRLPANTFGRHCSIELYWQSQYTAPLSTVITAHQGYSYAATGWRSKTKAITVATAPKITRIILSLPRRLVFNDGQSDSSSTSYDAQKFWFTREK